MKQKINALKNINLLYVNTLYSIPVNLNPALFKNFIKTNQLNHEEIALQILNNNIDIVILEISRENSEALTIAKKLFSKDNLLPILLYSEDNYEEDFLQTILESSIDKLLTNNESFSEIIDAIYETYSFKCVYRNIVQEYEQHKKKLNISENKIGQLEYSIRNYQELSSRLLSKVEKYIPEVLIDKNCYLLHQSYKFKELFNIKKGESFLEVFDQTENSKYFLTKMLESIQIKGHLTYFTTLKIHEKKFNVEIEIEPFISKLDTIKKFRIILELDHFNK